MALTLLSANNASTVLSAGISASATTLAVNTGTGGLFPSPVSGTSFFKLTLIDAATGTLTEIVHVTSRSGDVMTIVRAQEGTPARLWSANDIAANMLTAGTIAQLAQKDLSLQTANNLSEIATAGPAAVAAAVANLGLTEAAAAAADALKKSANLSDLTNKSSARSALDLGNSATKNVGAVAGTVMAGDDARVIGALQASSNLSDLTNKSASRVNLNVYSRDEVVPALGGEFIGRVTFPVITIGGVQGVGIQISTNTEVKVNGDIAGPVWTNNQDSLLSTWISKQITAANMNKVTAIRRGVVHEVPNTAQAGSFAVTAFVTQTTIFVAELQYQVNGQWIVMGQA